MKSTICFATLVASAAAFAPAQESSRNMSALDAAKPFASELGVTAPVRSRVGYGVGDGLDGLFAFCSSCRCLIPPSHLFDYSPPNSSVYGIPWV
jgi:hypothetical protein